MRVSIVGGGLFGCTAAIHAARAGHDVTLYEKEHNILCAASAINQFRLHTGLHYPRSDRTARECKASLASFRAEYGNAIIDGGDKHYAIAREGSKVGKGDYIAFCQRHSLPITAIKPLTDALELTIKVRESRIDPVALYTQVSTELLSLGVHVKLGEPAHNGMRDCYDRIILAGYAGTNEIASELGASVTPFQFEVVEKPVIRLPDQWRDFSMVVMDGPFCSLDPYGSTGLHVIGHVKHALHAVNTGLYPEIPDNIAPDLNRGVVKHPNVTRASKFLKAAEPFMPFIKDAEYVGSMYTVRAVLPDMDDTDARPTLVQRLDDQCIRIFSGKLGSAVLAAQRAVEMLSPTPQKTGDQAELVA